MSSSGASRASGDGWSREAMGAPLTPLHPAVATPHHASWRGRCFSGGALPKLGVTCHQPERGTPPYIGEPLRQSTSDF